ncbi:MAG: DUF1648 domain-containing protein [Terriglobales bacterium]
MDSKLYRTKLYRTMTALLWLALPLAGLQYGRVWDRLPARMAIHFGAAGQPNGWMSRETALIFTLVLLFFLLSTFTWVLTRVRQADTLAWSLLAMLYVVMGVLYSIDAALLSYNLYGRPLNLVPELVVVFVAAFVVIAVALGAKRGAELPGISAVVEAEEVHASPLWALGFAVLSVIELGVAFLIPLRGLRLVMTLPVFLLLAVTALAWSGFRYRFTTQGVEISTLGFRLRSIPLQNIKAYSVAPWNPMGGYGIRGVGERRAYVWGNTGVRIMLSDGEVFLGHRDPERIMRDLNMVKQNQKARETTRSGSL